MIQRIPNYPKYLVTDDGRVWSIKTYRWLKPFLRSGYPSVCISNQRGFKNERVHRIVLEAFVGPCPSDMVCRHLDGNPLNNNSDNLKWGTCAENQKDRSIHGTSNKSKMYNMGESHPSSKLKESEVRNIIELYHLGIYSLKDLAKEYNVYYTTIQKL